MPPYIDLGDKDMFGLGGFAGGRPVSKPLLRSRPAMDFSGRPFHSGYQSSFVSGSTLAPSINNVSFAPQKAASSIGFTPRIPIHVIASLDDSEIGFNPHYCKLRRKFENMSEVLSTYLGRDLQVGNSHTATVGEAFTPDIDQARAPCNPDSRASSLGPSDSASQQSRLTTNNLNAILHNVESLPIWPDFLPASVLWYYEDCEKDKSGGDILTEANKHQPKMNLAICRPDGTIISSKEFSKTRTFIKVVFNVEYQQAVLELEAEQTLLRLCSAHWKAECMIAQAFQWRSNALSKATANCKHTHTPSDTFDGLDLQLPEPPTAPIMHISNVVPLNVVKCALELSAGPKSPSALQAQKHSKDDSIISRQKTSINIMYLASNAEVTNAEPAPVTFCPIFVDPSAILTSDFPALTSAPGLIRSMNVQPSFKQGNASQNVTTLLKHVQSADLASLDFDEDDKGKGWGHYQFTAGGITLSSSLTTWQEVGSVATAFKLVAAALKTCQEVWQMCKSDEMPMSGFISDIYLKNTLECLERCWAATDGEPLTAITRVHLYLETLKPLASH
ncbi:hypothetical protein EI94DRAFT_1707172 [Lactarius quietus]|nr:hypothetical protein EI94DRAFT_1707172 [Lactarius quietus]